MAAQRNFTVRISLDGGTDIKSQLEKIGSVGQKAFKDLADAANGGSFFARFNANIGAVVARLQSAGAAAASFGRSFLELGSATASVASRLGLFSSVSLTGVVTGLAGMIKSAGEAQEQLQNTADAIGITTAQLGKFKAISALAGVSGESIERGLLKLNAAMTAAGTQLDQYNNRVSDMFDEYRKGKVEYSAFSESLRRLNRDTDVSSNAFRKLGIEFRDSNGKLRNTKDVLLDIADAFKELPNNADKSALAMELFGSKNARMVSVLNQGAAGIKAMEKEAARLAPGLDKFSADALDRAADSFTQLGMTVNSVRKALAALFAPSFERVMTAITEAIVSNRTDLILFAATIADKIKPAVEDIIALLGGRDADVKNKFFITLRDNAIQFAKDTKDAVVNVVIPALMALFSALDIVAKAFNAVFGTDMTGGQLAMVLVITKLLGLFGLLKAAINVAVVGVGALITTFGAIPVAIAAVGFAIGFLLVKLATDWEGTTTRIRALWDALMSLLPQATRDAINSGIVEPFTNVVEVIRRIVSGLIIIVSSLFNGEFVNSLSVIWTFLKQQAASAVQGIADAFTQGLSGIVGLFSDAASAISGVWDLVKQAATDAASWIAAQFSAGLQLVTTAFNAVIEPIIAAWTAVKDGATDAAHWLNDQFNAALTAVTGYFRSWYDSIAGWIDGLVTKAKALASAISSAVSGGDSSGGDTQGYASGGRITGSGSGTSDSILIRASNGEFMMPKVAVDFFGLPFMEAIRRLRNPFAQIGQAFAGGSFLTSLTAGLMPASAPRYATGGPISTAGGGGSDQPVVVSLDGRQYAMRAEQSVIDRLHHYSTGRQIRSGGRKPLWYKG